MKKKTVNLGKKLFFDKDTVVSLSNTQKDRIAGGVTAISGDCGGCLTIGVCQTKFITMICDNC